MGRAGQKTGSWKIEKEEEAGQYAHDEGMLVSNQWGNYNIGNSLSMGEQGRSPALKAYRKAM